MADGVLKLISIITFTLGIPSGLIAQINMDAHLRNRFELRDGYQKLAAAGSVPAALVSQRTRVTLNYQSEQLKIKIAAQDVRLWGDNPIMSVTGTGDNATLGLFEGYAEIRLGNRGWLSTGRQQLIYDKEWIFAARNWNQNGIAYDAAVLKLKFSNCNLHVGSSWNTMTEGTSDNFYPSSRIKSLNYVWLNHKITSTINISLIQVASGVTKSDSENKLYFRQTSGIFAEFKKEHFNAYGNAYYQYGKNQQGKSVNAFLIHLDASYQTGRYTAGTGFAILSGNQHIGSEQLKDRLFDNLYGARHRYFGFLDYFRSSDHTQQGGLNDYFVSFDATITERINLRNVCHYFRLNQPNPLTLRNKNLGFENDLVLKYTFNNWGTFESGFMFILPTETLQAIQNVPDAKFSRFVYFQLTIMPTWITAVAMK